MPWVAAHLITGQVQVMEKFPFILGSSPDVDFHCPGEGVPEQAVWIQSKGKAIQLDFHSHQGLGTRSLLNGPEHGQNKNGGPDVERPMNRLRNRLTWSRGTADTHPVENPGKFGSDHRA